VALVAGLLLGQVSAESAPADKPAQKAAGARVPVPDQAALEAARKQISEVFGEQIARAKSAEHDAALASRLLKTADESANNPAVRYVLLRLAAEHTAASGKVSAGLRLLDNLGESYAVDVLSLKADLLASTAELLKSGKRKLAEGENLPEAFFSLIDEAMAADHFVVAKRLADLGISGARKARNLELARQFTDRAREIEKLRKDYEPVAAALELLETNPLDPAANSTVGQWQCFHKGDWERGLPMLALGDDAQLAELAKRELRLTGLSAGPSGAPLVSPAKAQGKGQPDTTTPRSGAAAAKRLASPAAGSGQKQPKDADAPPVAPVARNETEIPAIAKDLLALADAWVDWAKTRPKFVQAEVHSHAASCIELALPALTGLEKAAAEKRLQDLEASAESETEPARSTARGVVQKGNVALASNGTTVTSVGKPIEMAADLLDGVTQPVPNARHAYSAWPCEWIITFPKVYRLQQIRFRLWDLDDRHHRYALATSADGRTFVPLVDRSQGEWRGWQVIPFAPRPVKAVKLLGLYNSANSNFFVVEFEAYCVPPRLPRQFTTK